MSEAAKAEAAQHESERKQRLAGSLVWQERGVYIFIGGLIISTVGAVV